MTKSLTVRHTVEPNADRSVPDTHQDPFSKTFLGFWIYIMTDCLIFATLFITYAVMHDRTFGGPTSHDLFDLSTAFAETLFLLFSSVTCGFAMLATIKHQKNTCDCMVRCDFFVWSFFYCHGTSRICPFNMGWA